MSYAYKREIDLPFEETIKRVKQELKKQGFGVLTEIDVNKTFKEKLNIDYSNYLILGACNPPFAHKALESEKEIGLLLPCNVIIYVDDEKTHISAINPVKAMSAIDNPQLKEIAEQIREKLEKVIESV